MKKIFIFVFFMLALISGSVKAQITDVYAGNDTLELRVGNYQYGFVQWQTARDTTDWTDIEGAIDTVYRFLPTKNAYYRARATFPTCSEVFSAVCYVQVPPKVDAGPDRNLAVGDGATMFAMLEDGCVGEWEIIEGEDGVLSDLHDPNAWFEGTGSEYKLKWTVTNACGSASDTLSIHYIPTVMNDNILVVDTTDFILSDSSQLLNGEYLIAFSEPVTLNDSMLLVGMRDDSFLRKVVSYTYDEANDVYDIMTVQGTLADLLIDGVFSFDLSSAFNNKSKRVVVTDHYPTRKEMTNGGWKKVYIVDREGDDNALRWNSDIGEPHMNWTPGGFKLPYDFEIIPIFRLYQPNFLCELKGHGLHVDSFKFGLYNTDYYLSADIYVPGKASFSLKEKLPILPKPIRFPSIVVYGVKLTPELSCDLNLSLQYSLGPDMYFYLGQTGYVSSYIIFDDETGWDGDCGISRHYDFDSDWPEYGNLTGKASIDLKMAMLGFDILGPYVGFSLAFEGTHNTFGEGFTAQQFKIKEEYKLGAKMKVFDWNIFDVDWPFITFDMLDYQDPYSIHYVSGNNQTFKPGHQLDKPLVVNVKKKNGKPSKGVRVKFETGGASHPVYTNDQGIASVTWTPSVNSSGAAQAKASSYNVKNEPVEGAPIIFNAMPFQSGGGGGGGGGGGWGGGSTDCSTLAISAYVNGSGVLLPRASGGHPPYLFSKDGVSYGSSVFYIPVQGQTYHFYVKDSEGCINDCYYTHPTQDCSSSTLSLRLSAQGSTVTAYASGGQPPYQYDLDGEGYSSVSVFYNLTNGDHTVNVRDANGCVDVATIQLDAYGGGGTGGGGTNSGSVTVTTSPTVEVVDATTAHGSGSVSVTGNATVSRVGLCWSRHHGPTTNDEYVQSSYTSNTFGNLMVNLTPNVMYYLRAFAVTSKGTVYGKEVGFSTTAMPPVVTCTGVGNYTSTSAKAWGNASTTNGTYVTERGFCWSTRHNPTIHDDHLVCGVGTGAFSGNITGLMPATVYYLRAYAINSEGTGYSDEVRFETYEDTPVQSFTIQAVAKPLQGGRVSGMGTYVEGSNCTLKAMANEGYTFVFWTEDDVVVSDNATYSFGVTDDRNLEAIFAVSSDDAPEGAINGLFSVGEGHQVYFSQGNLQYQASTNTWKFAQHQWDFVGYYGNQNISPTYSGWIDLFGWGTSGYDHGAVCYQPWSTSNNSSDYYAYGNPYYNLYDQTGQADWGYNAIVNGGNQTNMWYTLSQVSCNYLLYERNTSSGLRFAKAIVGIYPGVILFPDDWDGSLYSINDANANVEFDHNRVSYADWYCLFEPNGAVFLPTAGSRSASNGEDRDDYWGHYWLSSQYGSESGCAFTASEHSFHFAGWARRHRFSVRLVRNVPSSVTLPEIQSTEVTNITSSSAVCGGNIVSDDGTDITECGVCWSTGHNPTSGDNHIDVGVSVGIFLLNIKGLSPETTYYVRAYASNAVGTAYGNEVSFTTLPEGTGNVPSGVINGLFSVSESHQVYFSQGNLQYIGGTPTPCWKFADQQWVFLGDNGQGSDSPYVDRDLFGWGTSGYDHGAVCYHPWSTSENISDYRAYGVVNYNLYDQTAQADWGYNAISNGGDASNTWRTPTADEWSYLFDSRQTASGARYAKAQVNQVKGVILLPDNWNISDYPLNNTNDPYAGYASNILSVSQWTFMELSGAVFLPVTGGRFGTVVYDMDYGSGFNVGSYWSSSCFLDDPDAEDAYSINFNEDVLFATNVVNPRYVGMGVRLVRSNHPNPHTDELPQVITSEITDVSSHSATCGGTVVSDGGLTVTERGICWNHGGGNPTINDNRISCGAGLGSFSVEMTDLGVDVGYHVRAYAINEAGVVYGERKWCYIAPWYVWTSYISMVTSNSAFYVGGASSGTNPALVKGACWSTHPNPTLEDEHSAEPFDDNNAIFGYIYGLTPNTTYYFRTYVTDDYQTYYSSEQTFHTLPEGGLSGLFSVGDDRQVYFSKGNLQYQAVTNTWMFAENQWDHAGADNTNISPAYDGWIDLFGWGTSGYDHGAVCYQPWSTSQNYNEYFAYGSENADLYDQTGQADWGYNAVANGGDQENLWRTLTQPEWDYLLNERNTASGMRYALAVVNGVNGVILISDLWNNTDNITLVNPNTMGVPFQSNVFDAETWEYQFKEAGGCAFLPATGMRSGTAIESYGANGLYWSSDADGSYNAHYVDFFEVEPHPMVYSNRQYGFAVRLVQDYNP